MCNITIGGCHCILHVGIETQTSYSSSLVTLISRAFQVGIFLVHFACRERTSVRLLKVSLEARTQIPLINVVTTYCFLHRGKLLCLKNCVFNYIHRVADC
jgi:hypothetical protein